jgi:hypothetical protein
MRRIEVVNLDRWVAGFLKRSSYSHNIDYGNNTEALWDKALTVIPSELNLDDKFYREEWERVIQPQTITSFPEYMKPL